MYHKSEVTMLLFAAATQMSMPLDVPATDAVLDFRLICDRLMFVSGVATHVPSWAK